MSFEYYYKTNQCTSQSAHDADCVCWHAEGTGPFKDQRHDDADTSVTWRTSEEAPGDRDLGGKNNLARRERRNE